MTKPRPLDKDEVASLREDDFELVTIDGELYVLDDLYVCRGCGKHFLEEPDISFDEDLCEPCAELAEETVQADKDMQSDYYANCM